MSNLPTPMLSVLAIFLPLFSSPSYLTFLAIFQGHILLKGRRTVTEILRQLSLKNIKNFSKFHYFFSKAKWSSLKAAEILFLRLISLVPGTITVYMDTTVERRKGSKIKGLGIQRDAVRSTKSRKVLVPGLNWLVCAIEIEMPWSNRSWALPFLSILMPPENPLSSSKNEHDLNKIKKHKPLSKWACQVAALVRFWLGKSRKIIIVADSAFATYALANTCIDLNIQFVSRMRLDSRLFDFPFSTTGRGRKRLVGNRLATFKEMLKDNSLKWESKDLNWYSGTVKTMEILTGSCLWYGYGIRPVPIKWVLTRDPKSESEPTALFITDVNACPIEIIRIFIGRWLLEVTFEEARRHLGMETQRQWSDQAIDRITPCILASYSVISLIAIEFQKEFREDLPLQSTSWYKKSHATFSDVLAYVRGYLLRERYFLGFGKTADPEKIDLEELIALLAAA